MLLALTLTLALGCTSSSVETLDEAPTYNSDIAPIIRDRCESCHSEGQVGPFRLNTFAEVSAAGSLVTDSVVNRRMPPFLADDSCNDYVDSNWMSQDEIDLVAEWFDAGMPEGDPEDALAAFEPDPATLPDATHSVVIPGSYAPDFEGEPDDYRCFVVDPALVSDGFLTGFEILPGDADIVHHLIIYQPTSESELAKAYEREGDNEGLGYPCFGGPKVDASMVAAWAPSSWVNTYPEGKGIRVTGDMPLILQMHYNDAGTVAPADATEVKLRIEPTIDEEMYSFFWTTYPLNIPAGEPEWTESTSVRIDRAFGAFPGQLELVTAGPHMHTLGRSLKASITHEDGSETCLLDVPRWDFNWQFGYDFVEPEPIVDSDTVTLTCTYDSSDRDQTTTWGDGTSDEMCLATMYVTYSPG